MRLFINYHIIKVMNLINDFLCFPYRIIGLMSNLNIKQKKNDTAYGRIIEYNNYLES